MVRYILTKRKPPTMKTITIKHLLTTLFAFILCLQLNAHPILDYYKAHKNDHKMEAKIVPPKAAAQLVDEDYPEAIEVLKSMTSLRYLNFYGDQNKIKRYAEQAISSKGDYQLLLDKVEGTRSISVYGVKENGLVRRLFVVVQTKTQFILMIGRGKLTQKHLDWLPALSEEI